jgi:Ser/Thr protein kinase RdoA (MazF antagonist)
MGNVTLAVAVLSYDGQLNLTAIADRDTCPDVEVFASGVRATLDDLGRSVCHTDPMSWNVLLR